ncbi:MAG: 4-hydroxythreonine-4-phosphate dehydrogenase PdxA [Gemmatimonadota bacterium]
MTSRPRIGITLGDPRGIGPEVSAAALDKRQDAGVDFRIIGPTGLAEHEAALDGLGVWETIGDWTPSGGARLAGQLSAAAIVRAVELVSTGVLDGIVTAPISKAALHAAGYTYPGHTEFLQDLSGTSDVTMMMSAESTPLNGPLRMALLTAHLPLRSVPDTLTIELVVRRTRIAVEALRTWWGIPRPRISFAGLNPHAGEGGLFGDEEAEVINPAIDRIGAAGDVEILGVFPADTVFRHTLEGTSDLVVTPYHDVGLAVLKTVARDTGVNVTAGLPFPRTSPDHGTALDIAGTGLANPGAMLAAVDLCVRFCNTTVTAP